MRARPGIHERFGCAVLVKGGHMKTAEAIDLFYDGREEFLLSAPGQGSVAAGTGCTYSAAITAFLARSERLPGAVELAKQHMERRFPGFSGLEGTIFWADRAWPGRRFSATFALFGDSSTQCRWSRLASRGFFFMAQFSYKAGAVRAR
ncbi:MAG: hypothetical protein CM1200mP29_04220 [Verrucomicrobiota bacterium]|nr:MAG: hypothetical protein CM1200mP29_04220 [Verrucomicrobiota bacterium]